MAGDNQHYIPQSLLRGFTRRSGSDGQVLVVTREKSYVANINRVASQRHFYGKPGPDTLDELITDFESRFGKLFHQLRTAEHNEILNVHGVCQMLAHLSLRTLAIRQAQIAMSQDMFGAVAEFGSDPVSVGSAFDQFVDDDGWMRKSCIDASASKGIRLSEKQVQDCVQQARLKYRQDKQSLVSNLGQSIGRGVEQLQMQLITSATETQYKLLKSFDERGVALIARFECLDWKLVDFDHGDKLFLGDCPVMIFDKEHNPTDMPVDEFIAVMLPVSSNRILLGRSESANVELSVAGVRNAVIQTASTFILCAPEMKSEHFDLRNMGSGRMENSSNWAKIRAEIRDSLATPLS